MQQPERAAAGTSGTAAGRDAAAVEPEKYLTPNNSLRPRFDRLRTHGLLTLHEMASALSVNPSTVKIWAAHGLLKAHAYTEKPECLYEPPGADRPMKAQGTKLSLRRPAASVIPERSKEVQCEA